MTPYPVRRSRTAARSIVLVAALAGAGTALADEPVSAEAFDALQRQVESLEEGQQAMREQLDALSEQLKSMTASRSRNRDLEKVQISTAGDPSKGDAEAGLVMVEFSDYQCPYCGRHFRQTLPRLTSEYIDTGKLRYVFKDLPLERIHKEAVRAAAAANCAGEQDRYWEMHDELFANQRSLADVTPIAERLELDLERFDTCLDEGSSTQEVRDDLAEARRLGVGSTPSFILGTTNPDGSVSGLRLVRGAVSFDTFKGEIDKLLARVEKSD